MRRKSVLPRTVLRFITTFRSTYLPRRTLKSSTQSSNLCGSTFLTEQKRALRDFMFRGLMFESEAAEFQRAGIQVGADVGQAEERLLSEALSPFWGRSSQSSLRDGQALRRA